jgi:hypothetical protein
MQTMKEAATEFLSCKRIAATASRASSRNASISSDQSRKVIARASQMTRPTSNEAGAPTRFCFPAESNAELLGSRGPAAR